MANGDFSVFPDDDYTGRMGPDGEPERYSTMRGGDPRVAQQREIEERARRLQEPFNIDNWLKSAGKDVRGTTAASQITLEPGTQYRIRDYSGKNDGQIIASGSTPEEFLMMQDIARGLARQGPNADYRLEQVGGQPTQNFGQYRDPSSGEVVSVIGGDLYNKPIAGDIIKIALPVALALIPGVGTGLSAGLAAKGSLAAKMIGAGLASGIGRTAAGVLTGDPVLDSLKAGAISGLGSAATAGLLDKIGVDKALSNAFSSTKGALAGEAVSQGVGQGISEAAKKAAEESLITVVGSRFAPTVLSGGLSAAGGSLLGDVGKSLVQPDRFQQALDRARLLNNELGLDEIIVSASKNAATSPLSQLASGAAAGGFDQFLSDNAGMVGDEPELLAEADRIKRFEAEAAAAAAAGAAIPTGALSAAEGTVEPELLAEADRIKRFEAEAAAAAAAGGALPAAEGTVEPELLAEADRIKRFEAEAAAAAAAGGALPAGEGTVEPEVLAEADRIKRFEAEAAAAAAAGGALSATDTKGDTTGDKKKDTLDKIADAATIAGLVIPAIGALAGDGKGGGTGTYIPGGGSFDPNFSAKLPTPGEGGAFTVGGLGPATGPNPLAARPTADWYRYATGPAMDMPRGVDLSRATSPYAGFGPGTLGEETFNRITTGMARGGPMGYARGSSRDSFAVEGPGTGRSDDIPAVLSDGEYVIDAETVALLGDGSSRAGAKKLDELRVKVRKHKGKNLAKGKFSVNAKHPEAYMRGGRI
jgi:hypothetical protein